MEKALVAKSYENLEQITEPYELNGRMYVKVRMKNGQAKQVRAYSQKEYERYNPPIKIIQTGKSRREVFGFGEAGFIYLFRGNTYENLDWFHLSPCRYHRVWGWYLPSSEEVPNPLPEGVTTYQLSWETVSKDNELLSENELTKVIDEIFYEPSNSEFAGEIGDKVEFDGTLNKAIITENMYGTSYFFIFEDKNENIYTWTTATRMLNEGSKYHIKGSIKALTTYKRQKQTILTRCKVEVIDE